MPRQKEVSDAEIRKVARRVFLEKGTQTPVTVIAKELGVSSATLFLRMGSKDRLLIAALWPPAPPVEAVLDCGVRKETPVPEQLLEILYQLAVYVAVEIPAIFMLHAAGVKAPTDDLSNVTPLRLRRKLSRWIASAQAAGQLRHVKPDVAAELIMGTLEASNLHAFVQRREISSRRNRVIVRELVAAIFDSD